MKYGEIKKKYDIKFMRKPNDVEIKNATRILFYPSVITFCY